jgi:glutaconate CoA-transferase subunit A
LEDAARSGSVIPAIYINAVAHAPRGAWPLAFGDDYRADAARLTRYAAAARTAEGFASCAAELAWGAGMLPGVDANEGALEA